MDQPIKDFTFNEVQSHHEIRPLCLTEQGFAVIQHGYFCNNGLNFFISSLAIGKTDASGEDSFQKVPRCVDLSLDVQIGLHPRMHQDQIIFVSVFAFRTRNLLLLRDQYIPEIF